MTHQDTLTLQTRGHAHMQDITERVESIVAASGVRTGIVHVYNVGSTASIAMIEFEPGLRRDLPELLDRLIPPGRDYGHEQTWHDGNAHSHLQATLLGFSISVPVRDGRLVRGTWQQVVHLDGDTKPRQRTVVVTVMGE